MFTSLVGVLTLTSALLLALAPAPLTPDSTTTLFAMEPPETLDVIFNTPTPVQNARWKYIYVHHSRTSGGDAASVNSHDKTGMGDHFLIGNGEGAIDGVVQVGPRWYEQNSAAAPAGARSIEPTCISICLVGDFDQTRPTPTQLRRLTQLVSTLQARFRIPAESVMMVNQPANPAAIGKYFPVASVREQLLP